MENHMLQAASDARHVAIIAGRLFLVEYTLPPKKAVRAETRRKENTSL
jgi:hypothetical protein